MDSGPGSPGLWAQPRPIRSEFDGPGTNRTNLKDSGPRPPVVFDQSEPTPTSAPRSKKAGRCVCGSKPCRTDAHQHAAFKTANVAGPAPNRADWLMLLLQKMGKRPLSVLPPLKVWLALLQEGLDRLFVVLGGPGLLLGDVGQLQAFFKIHRHALQGQIFDEGQGDHRPLGQAQEIANICQLVRQIPRQTRQDPLSHQGSDNVP